MIAKLFACCVATTVLLPQVAPAKDAHATNQSYRSGWRSTAGIPYRETIPWLTAQSPGADELNQSVGLDLDTLRLQVSDSKTLISRYSSMPQKGFEARGRQGR